MSLVVVYLFIASVTLSYYFGKSQVERTITQDWCAGRWGAYRTWKYSTKSQRKSVAEYLVKQELGAEQELERVKQLHVTVYEALKEFVNTNRTLALTSPNPLTRDIAKQILSGNLTHPSEDLARQKQARTYVKSTLRKKKHQVNYR